VTSIRYAERNKRRGVSYAVTNDGLELPVLDVTHPAFAFELSDDKLEAMRARFMSEQERIARVPSWLQRALARFFLRGSRIGRGLRRAEQGFLDSMTTYLFKLGPEHLGSYAVAVDHKILSSLPAISVRLRAQDMARLLADELAPRLAADASPALRLLNIAGGPAIDSLNTLLVLRREQPELLASRRIEICVLDGDARGPDFGARALAALQEPGAALAGLSIAFEHIPYDWRDRAPLTKKLHSTNAGAAVLAVSSEGGLFEYGSDDDVTSNLRALASAAEGRAPFMVGSVTRDDAAMRALKRTSRLATVPRGLPAFAALVERAGWRVARSISRPFSDQVLLTPNGGDFERRSRLA